MDQLTKLGIKIGEGSLIDMQKSEFDANSVDYSQVVRKGNGSSPRDVLEEQINKGTIGLPITQVLTVPVDPISQERTKLPNEKKKEEYLKDTHGESFHSDDDAEVKEEHETTEEIRLSMGIGDLWNEAFLANDPSAQYLDKSFKAPPLKPSMVAKKPEKSKEEKKLEHQQKKEAGLLKSKDSVEEMAKQAATIKKEKMGKKKADLMANIHENSKEVVKSELDEAFAWLEKSDKFDFDKNGKLDAHEKAHKDEKKTFDKFNQDVKELKEEEKEEHKTKKACGNKVVKSYGPGGIIFDFGFSTGNAVADQATALLNQNADHTQASIVKDQRSGFEKSLESFVEKGEQAFMQAPNESNLFDPHNRLGKSMDEQVKEAFAKGEFDDKSPIVNQYNKTETKVGNQVIKATSETDAALIEMMKGQLDLENEGGVELVQKITAGL